MRILAKEFGISDVGLAKVCRKLGVPVPGRGYWAKKVAGRVVPREAESAAHQLVLQFLPGQFHLLAGTSFVGLMLVHIRK